MAFDQHLEADRIDDFNLFSAFVRVPLLILEGVLGQQQQKQQNKDEPASEEGLDDVLSNCFAQRNMNASQDKSVNSPPRVVSNDDLASPLSKRKSFSRFEGQTNNKSLSRRRTNSASLVDLVECPGLKRTSWSDESGRSLVEVFDESVRHEPISPYQDATSTTVPKKSAMKRSVRSQVEVGEKRYIPNMNHTSNGIVMPSRPFPGKGGPPTGEFSPQWGWYTSLTPPDVMYANNSHLHKRTATEPKLAIPDQECLNSSSLIIKEENQANHVFQSLQKSQAPVGWTSVPI